MSDSKKRVVKIGADDASSVKLNDLFPKNNTETSNNDECPIPDNSDSNGDELQVQMRSTREKRRPRYLEDYESRINHCTYYFMLLHWSE
ncbi:unnamed protein product [Dovyalis caffra]|uniref:Uncharacterized protein n=1 Tax=Dovyalis caffra TaxID=77055 RepID=A0AAV1SI44_9ROSI|nr:unnamed protein product [Dovyalis caffra]